MASFVRGIFAGALHDSLLFPYPPSLDRRDAAEARVVRRLIDDLRQMQREGIIDSERFDEEETIGEDVVRALARTGFLALSIPKEYGGLGLSMTGYARVFGELSRTDASLAVLVGVHCGLGSKAIVLFGNADQKARYLPMLARGETLAAYALTEPETGSDAQHIVTTARLSSDRTHWILNGRKLARVATDIYAADAMLGILTQLASSSAVGDAAEDWALEAACCKVFASDMIW